MKKQTMLLVLFSLLSINIFSQNIVSEQRNVGAFTGISSCCAIEVYLSEGNSSTITVKASGDEIDRVVTNVKGNTLHITMGNFKGNKKTKRRKKVEVHVSAKDIKSLEASSSSKISGQTEIIAKDLKLSVSSSGSITLNLKTENLKCDASSGGYIHLTGSGENARISSSSGAKIDMRDVTVSNANVDVSSGANARVTAKNEIKANASSGGQINYYGNPTKVNKSASSGGQVNRNN